MKDIYKIGIVIDNIVSINIINLYLSQEVNLTIFIHIVSSINKRIKKSKNWGMKGGKSDIIIF